MFQCATHIAIDDPCSIYNFLVDNTYSIQTKICVSFRTIGQIQISIIVCSNKSHQPPSGVKNSAIHIHTRQFLRPLDIRYEMINQHAYVQCMNVRMYEQLNMLTCSIEIDRSICRISPLLQSTLYLDFYPWCLMASINKREQNIEYRVYRLQTRKTDFRHFRSLLRGIQTNTHRERATSRQTDGQTGRYEFCTRIRQTSRSIDGVNLVRTSASLLYDV